MTAHTTTAHYKVSPERLFAFVSVIENLPKWATGYCKRVWKDGADYKIETPMGEMFQRFELDSKHGTIDMYGGPSKDAMWCWPVRVTSDNMGGSVLAFTCIQMPTQPDDEFQGQCATLKEELENIRNAVEK